MDQQTIKQPKRRRRPEQRPSEILDAAAEVFSLRGYDRATTREIAAEAGVSEGTLYRYYDSKRDMLLALIDRLGDDWNVDIDGLQVDSFVDLLAQTLAHMVRISKQRPLMILILQQAMLDPGVGEHFDAQIARGQDTMMAQVQALSDAGVLRQIDPYVIEEAIGGLIMGQVIGIELAARGWHRELMPPEEISRALADVLMNGLRAQPPAPSHKMGVNKRS
jgi:AcrR family transcriptional regulator